MTVRAIGARPNVKPHRWENRGGTVFGGHSMIVDPWGRIVVEAGEEPQLITAEIELDVIDDVRAKLPALNDVRTEVYD